jgi:outer membrane murein-binding lipoprotein Lpp
MENGSNGALLLKSLDRINGAPPELKRLFARAQRHAEAIISENEQLRQNMCDLTEQARTLNEACTQLEAERDAYRSSTERAEAEATAWKDLSAKQLHALQKIEREVRDAVGPRCGKNDGKEPVGDES